MWAHETKRGSGRCLGSQQVWLERRTLASTGSTWPRRAAPPPPTPPPSHPCPAAEAEAQGPPGQQGARQTPAEKPSASHILRTHRFRLVPSQPETSVSSEVSTEHGRRKAEPARPRPGHSSCLATGFLRSAVRDAGRGTKGGISRIPMCQQAMLPRWEDLPGQTHSSNHTRDTALGKEEVGGGQEQAQKERGDLDAPPTVRRAPPLTSLNESS